MKSIGPSHADRLPDSADRVLLLRNPMAGAGATGDLIEALIRELTSRGFATEVMTDLGQLQAAVRIQVEQGRLRTVIAAGGDGTAETLANLIPADAPLTMFPLGTENLLAKYLGLSANPALIAKVIASGRLLRLDAGEIRAGGAPAQLFLLMMGCGFDAEVIHRLHQSRAGHITHLSYAKPILDAIRTYDYPTVEVTCYEEPGGPPVQTITAHWVFVFNTPSYAFGLEICPDADPFDGKLDLVTFHGGSSLHGFLHLGNILLGRHRRQRSVRMARTGYLRITSDRPVPVQLDGDPGGALPVEIRVQPQRLTVVVPEEWTNHTLMR